MGEGSGEGRTHAHALEEAQRELAEARLAVGHHHAEGDLALKERVRAVELLHRHFGEIRWRV